MRKKKLQVHGGAKIRIKLRHTEATKNFQVTDIICLGHVVTLTLIYSGHIRGYELLEILASHISKYSASTLEKTPCFRKKTQSSTMSRLENAKFLSKPEKLDQIWWAGAWQWHCTYPALAWEQANEIMALTRELMNGSIFVSSISKLENCLTTVNIQLSNEN